MFRFELLFSSEIKKTSPLNSIPHLDKHKRKLQTLTDVAVTRLKSHVNISILIACHLVCEALTFRSLTARMTF